MRGRKDEQAGLLILLANLGVLGLTLKLYTEYFKDRAQDRRAAPKTHGPSKPAHYYTRM